MTLSWTGHSGTTISADARWLRACCRCDECGDSSAGLRWFSPSGLTEVAAVDLTLDDSTLHVHWNDGHRSRFDRAVLEARLVPTAAPTIEAGPNLLDLPLVPRDHAAVCTDDEALHAAIDELVRHGVTRFRSTPPGAEHTARLARRFGPIRTTSYGEVQEFRTVANPKTAAETGRAQTPHTDEPFRYSPPGYLFFHSAEAAPEGEGSSLLVDGVEAARHLRAADPEAFEVLATVPIRLHRRHADEVDFETRACVLTLDAAGEPSGVRLNTRCLADLDPHEPRLGALLHALAAYTRIIESPEHQRIVHLHAGDMLAFDNHRIMHGRTAFSDRWPRHLLSCNVDRDAVHSTWRVLAAAHGSAPAVLSAGASA